MKCRLAPVRCPQPFLAVHDCNDFHSRHVNILSHANMSSNYTGNASDRESASAIISRLSSNVRVISVQDATPKAASRIAQHVYKAFDIPKGVADMTPQQGALMLCKLVKRTLRGKERTVVFPAKALRLPHGLGTWSYNFLDIRNKPDLDMFKCLKVAGLDEAADATQLLVRANGTKRGLFTRISDKLVTGDPQDRMKIPLKNLKLARLHKYESRITIDSPAFSYINGTSCAGLPYMFEATNQYTPKLGGKTCLPIKYSVTGTKVTTMLPESEAMPILLHALHHADEMFRAVIDDASDFAETRSNMKRYFLEHPDLNTFLIKRKDDKMDRSEWDTKVRPYGVMPAPTRMFCMFAIKPLEDNLVCFVDDFDTISAYHYSPFYGGASQLISYFRHHTTLKRRFTGLCYGDDQLWCFRLDNGELVFMTPDVAAMDMSTRNYAITDMLEFVAQQGDMPSVNARALMVALTCGFMHQMHIGGSQIVSKEHSFLSGTPGTTVINIGTSAKIQQHIENKFNACGPLSRTNFFPTLVLVLEEVKSLLGFTFKEMVPLAPLVARSANTFDTVMQSGVFKNCMYHVESFSVVETGGIPLPFLSNQVKVIENQFVSVPFDMNKFGASLVLPGAFGSADKNRVLSRKERVAGIYYSGAWADPKWYAFLHDLYAQLSKVEPGPIIPSELHPILEKDILDLMKILDKPTLPPFAVMLDMNVMARDAFRAKYQKQGTHNLTFPDEEQLSSSSSSSSSSSTLPPPSAMAYDFGDVDDLDKLFVNDKSNTVTVKQLGHANALTQGERARKDAINKERNRVKAERRERIRQLAMAAGVPKKRYERWDDDEDAAFAELEDYFDDDSDTPAQKEFNELRESRDSWFAAYDGYDSDHEIFASKDELEDDSDLDDLFATGDEGNVSGHVRFHPEE